MIYIFLWRLDTSMRPEELAWKTPEQLATLVDEVEICVSAVNTSVIFDGHLLEATYVTGWRGEDNKVGISVNVLPIISGPSQY